MTISKTKSKKKLTINIFLKKYISTFVSAISFSNGKIILQSINLINIQWHFIFKIIIIIIKKNFIFFSNSKFLFCSKLINFFFYIFEASFSKIVQEWILLHNHRSLIQVVRTLHSWMMLNFRPSPLPKQFQKLISLIKDEKNLSSMSLYFVGTQASPFYCPPRGKYLE